MIMAKAVMRTGRKPGEAGFDGRSDGISWVQQQFFGKRNHENTVRRSYAHAHNGAHQGRYAEGCMRYE